MCEKLYIKKINPVFAIAKTKAEDNINIISLLNSAYKKIRMNDKMKHLRRCFRIAAHGYKDFSVKNRFSITIIKINLTNGTYLWI